MPQTAGLMPRTSEYTAESHTLPPQSEARPAEMRVTPQEFAQAVEQIEARHEQERRRERETVGIEEAVSALGLSFSANEIWSEVQRQRAQTSHANHAPNRAASFRWWPGLITLSVITNIVLGASLVSSIHSRNQEIVKPTAAVLSRPSVKGDIRNGFSRLLSEVQDDETVYTDTTLLQSLAVGEVDAKQTYVAKAMNTPGTLWPLHRENGHWFVHAWTSDSNALRLQNHTGPGVSLFKENVGVQGTQVYVPVEMFAGATVDDSDMIYGSVEVQP